MNKALLACSVVMLLYGAGCIAAALLQIRAAAAVRDGDATTPRSKLLLIPW